MMLDKKASESRIYDFDFSSLDPRVTAITVPQVTQRNTGKVPASVDMGQTGVVVEGPVVQVRFSAGTIGEVYEITIVGTDQDNNILEMDDCFIRVIE